MDEMIKALEEALKDAAPKGAVLPKVESFENGMIECRWRGVGPSHKGEKACVLKMGLTDTVLDMPRYAKNIWHAYDVATR